MVKKANVSLADDPIGRLIWKMSAPAALGVLSYNIYNIVDTVYIARGIGTDAAGGLAISFPLFIFLSAVSNTVGSGAASVISRALGKNDMEKANRSAANTFGLFWVTAVIVTIFGIIFLDDLLYGMGVTVTLLPYARSYTRIILIGSITSTGFSSLIRAEGNSRYAMYLWIIPVIANCILDPIFIFAFKLGVEGAAIATVLSQCVSVFMSLYFFFFSGKSKLKIKPRHFAPDIGVLKEIILIGLPSFLQIASHSVTIVLINNILKIYGGDLSISTYGIVNKISTFLLIPQQGLLQGVQPVIGYNYGAGSKARVVEALKVSSIIAGCYGIIVVLLLSVLSGKIILLFSTDRAVISMGSSILTITNLGLVFSGVYAIRAAYFQAIGKSIISMIMFLGNYLICFIPALLILSWLLNITGVWFSFPISSIFAFILSSILLSLRKGDLRHEFR